MKRKKKTKTVEPKLSRAERKAQKKEAEKRELYEWEIKSFAKTINDRYRRLEKAGLEDRSQSYKTVEHYAVSDPKGKGKHYKVDYAKGTLRVSADTRGMSLKELESYKNQLLQIMHHKTSTVTGTRAAIKKAYETAKDVHEFKGSQDYYEKVWDMYRNNVAEDKKARLNSETVMSILENTTIYDMSADDIDAALQYITTSETKDESEMRITEVQEVINLINSMTPEEAAEEILDQDYEEYVDMFPHLFEKVKPFIDALKERR